ncbi:hypothetical protein LCM4577_28540 [Mesorhizobium sp. LCM 4577]|nr:hypothetical protein LCM4577_28540 [Mesorhizobium sp. LCM 4577]
MILPPGKTPPGKEIRGHLRCLSSASTRAGRPPKPWSAATASYCQAQVMAWCDNNALDYLFGLPGKKVLPRLADEAANDIP